MTLDVFEVVPLGIPQGNQLLQPSNLLTDYLKQTTIREPLITDCSRWSVFLAILRNRILLHSHLNTRVYGAYQYDAEMDDAD